MKVDILPSAIVDMARLLDDYPLEDIFAWYREKYPAANPALAMRSLSYFADAGFACSCLSRESVWGSIALRNST